MYAYIKHSVGKYGTNAYEDVMSIQIRLNRWMMEGRLPSLEMLAVDGECGPKTKQAIGAFQLRYVDIPSPDCRVDPNGKTLDMLFQSLVPPAPRVPEVSYIDWLNSLSWTSESTPAYWEKRGMFWAGVGGKASYGSWLSGDGFDTLIATLYNTESPWENKFILNANTRRLFNFGGGVSAGGVLCFATGIYFPSDFANIESGEVDFNIVLAGKWLAFANWALRIPNLTKMVSAAQIGHFADYKSVSNLVSTIKGGISGFGLAEDDPRPNFVAIDIPVGGLGIEVDLYYGITNYNVTKVHLA